MEDLLQSQIRESCALALPNGLQDLMADISREVLRAQPQNLYQFIAEYLAALLVSRENLSVAARVCENVCKAECWPELEDELRSTGLSDEDIEMTGKTIMEFIQGDQVEERNLLLRLVKKTEIEEEQFPAVLKAVRRAYLTHKLNTEGSYDSSSDSELDETTRAARHTVKLYRKTIRPDEDYTRAAEKIQAAYRAYRVRRKKRDDSHAHDHTDKSIRFSTKAEDQRPDSSSRHLERCCSRVSSVSLAGSFITLPPFTPYSNTYSDILEPEEDVKIDVDGEMEMERTNIDYDGNEGKKEPRKLSVHYVSSNSLQGDEKEIIATEEIWEKVIDNDDNREEIISEAIIEADKGVFHVDTNETVHERDSEVISDEDEEVIEKVMSDDEKAHSDQAEFMIESEDDDGIDDDKSCDLYSNKEFDYESSKETYDD